METKRKINSLATTLLSLLTLCSCGGEVGSCSIAPRFTLPSIPKLITVEVERREYLAEHYWDNYNFADTLLTHNDSIRGVAVAGYVTLLGSLSDTAAVAQSIDRTLGRSFAADKSALLELTSTLEDYLYDPNSPMRNEELYIPILRYLIECDSLSEAELLRPHYQLRMALKNRVGTTAADFVFVTREGRKGRMHDIEAEYTVVLFNNPECEECARVKGELGGSSLVGDLCRTKRLVILAIDPESSREEWLRAEYPSVMVNGYDDGQQINSGQLYDLKALPSLYLLDGAKRVLLKDCSLGRLMEYLNNIDQ